jgi:hypothetical protein
VRFWPVPSTQSTFADAGSLLPITELERAECETGLARSVFQRTCAILPQRRGGSSAVRLFDNDAVDFSGPSGVK